MPESSPIFSRSMVLETSGESLARADAGRQAAAEFREPFGYSLPRDVHIDAIGKGDRDDRQSGYRFGPQCRYARCAVDRIFDRPGDQFLDLSGAKPGRFGLDVHLEGTNSGNTSSGDCSAPQRPSTSASNVSTATAPWCRVHSVRSCRIMTRQPPASVPGLSSRARSNAAAAVTTFASGSTPVVTK